MAATVGASWRILFDPSSDSALSGARLGGFRSSPLSPDYHEHFRDASIQLHQSMMGKNGFNKLQKRRCRILALAASRVEEKSLNTEDHHLKGMGATSTLITIPVSYYQVLGLPDGALEEAIVEAHTQLKNSEIDEAYSVTAVLSRKELLEEVKARLLLDKRPKRSTWNRDSLSPSFFLSIPWAWLPGALVLLQEVGEDEIILNVGHAALQETNAHPYRQDILVAMSLAKCSMARAAFEKGTIAAGFEDLVQAHTILTMGKDSLYGSKLLANIEASLEEMAPACTLEHLSLPWTPDNRDKRAGALAALVELIRQGLSAEPSCSIRDWKFFMYNALGKLSAKEIVSLLPWETLFVLRKGQDTNEAQQQRVIFDVDCLYTVLIAHLAYGFSTRRPDLVETAKRLADALVAAEAVDIRLEHAICATLLGQADMAFGWLTNAAGSLQELSPTEFQKQDSCQQALQFISQCAATSREPDGELPGLCAYTERWLQNIGLKHFVDTSSCSPSLVDYYNTPEVKHYLITNGCRSMIKAASVEVKTPLPAARTSSGSAVTASRNNNYLHENSFAPSGPPCDAITTSERIPALYPFAPSAPPLSSMCTSEESNTLPQNSSALSAMNTSEKIASLHEHPSTDHLQSGEISTTNTTTPGRSRGATENCYSFYGTSTRKEPNNKEFSGQENNGMPSSSLKKDMYNSEGLADLTSLPVNQSSDSIPRKFQESDSILRRPFGDPKSLPRANASELWKKRPYLYLSSSQSVTEQLRKQAALRSKNSRSTQKISLSMIRFTTVVLLMGSAAAFCYNRNFLNFPWKLRASPAADILLCKICKFKIIDALFDSKPFRHNREAPRFEGVYAADPSFQKQSSSMQNKAAFREMNSIHQRGIPNPRPMPLKEAEAIIRHWQSVKAASLGPEYSVSHLPDILADKMLSQWRALSEKAKMSSCYWRFVLLKLKVVRADITADELGGETAELEAILEEAAELVDKSKIPHPNYYSTYLARYQLRRSADRTWRICQGGLESTI